MLPSQQSHIATHAILLVAGVGSRLGARTADRPKCLVQVNGMPILVNALQRLATAGIHETSLVVGYRNADIRACIGTSVGPMRVSYRTNPDYLATGTSRSLHIGLTGIANDVLILEGDVFFEQRVLDDLLSLPHPDVTLLDVWRPDVDGSVVTVTPDHVVSTWIHKNDRPAGLVLEDTCKTVNIHRFSAAFVRAHLWPALEAQVLSDEGREPIETVFARMLRDGACIHGAHVHGRWVEIDDEGDLRAAEAVFSGVPDGSGQPA